METASPVTKEPSRRTKRQQTDHLTVEKNRMTPKERMRRLNAAFDAMRAGLSRAQLDEMTAAMTED